MSTSASITRATAASLTMAITSGTEPTTPSLSPATASQRKSTTLLSTSAALPPTHQFVSSGLSSSTKAGIGVGVPVGISTVGLLLYFSIRQLRRRPRRDQTYAGTLTDAEVIPLGSRRYEKPELTGEDARRELVATERRGAELSGDEPRMEMDAMLRRV